MLPSLDGFLGALGWIPPWLWVAIAAMVIGAAVKFFGWRGALPASVGVAVVALLASVRRSGYEAREKEGAENVKRVVEKARQARQDVRDKHAADPSKLRDDDGYRRDK